MDREDMLNEIKVKGSVCFKILHMPENARYNFLVSLKQQPELKHRELYKFWKDCWKNRDINAEKLTNVGERFRFMKECCTGEVDNFLWSDRWKRIDTGDTNYLNAEERAEHLEYISQDIPKQKKYSMIDRMRRLGFLQDEPNFNEAAYEDFQKALQLSKL